MPAAEAPDDPGGIDTDQSPDLDATWNYFHLKFISHKIRVSNNGIGHACL
jgi:hypothetical protein